MRLKTIKLIGFKSFVDTTSVNFRGNLTAIVGPNGCGKSNVIDAVRWVMGESSAKYLRGESMTDVIFNGSTARKPVGRASIELIFDNASGNAAGSLAAFAEISIKREVTREGQSNYYLNGTRCRRKDITDIFLGTGLGPRSYAIIEQGMISRLIEAKPEELRVYIEEAAGISRYKERRRETENRMRRTRENLERLEDIREELARQLSRLERQAKAAEKYKTFKAEERDTKAQLIALRYDKRHQQLLLSERNIAELETKQEEHIAKVRNCEAKIETLRQDNHTQIEDLDKIQGRFYSVGAEISKLEQQITFERQRSEQLSTELNAVQMSVNQTKERIESEQIELDTLTEQRAAIAPTYEKTQASFDEAQSQLSQAEENASTFQERWEQLNLASSEAKRQADVCRSTIQHLEKSNQRILDRIQRLESEKNDLNNAPLMQELNQLKLSVETIVTRQESQKTIFEDAKLLLTEKRLQLQGLTQSLSKQRTQLQQSQGRLASLEALQQAAMSDQSQLGDWLESNAIRDNQRLLTSLTVQKDWEPAVELVLGNHLQAVRVDNLEQYIEKLNSALDVNVTLFESRDSEHSNNEGTTSDTLLSKVKGAGAYASLLAQVKEASHINDAIVMRESLVDNESVITPEGLWLSKSWVRVAKEDNPQSGMLNRQNEIDDLNATVNSSAQTVGEQEAAQSVLSSDIQETEQSLNEQQKMLLQTQREHSDLMSQISGKEVRLEQMSMRQQRMEQEVEEAQKQYKDEETQLRAARSNLETALNAMAVDNDEQEALRVQREESIAKLSNVRQQAQQSRDMLHEQTLSIQSLDLKINALKETIERSQTQISSYHQSHEQLKTQLAAFDSPEVNVQESLSEMLALRIEIESQLGNARKQVGENENAQREVEKERQHVEQNLHTLRHNLEELRISREKYSTTLQNFGDQLAELELTIEQAKALLVPEANEADWQENLSKLVTQIAQLGPINLAAIDEYKTQSERKTYLDVQNDDLTRALKTLESAINKIDKETRNRFKGTFDLVNKGVQELFPKVFGGGHAYLELTGDDLLNTGVAIMARPPGKRNSTIHLLSGGEKALTALSLVFSIFRLNPAPFCLLDEVDAPLDDVNVGRFCKLVKEMSEKVQFIYITHNKIAMEMAESLMGVTMQEAGVSRLVTVDVDEAVDMVTV